MKEDEAMGRWSEYFQEILKRNARGEEEIDGIETKRSFEITMELLKINKKEECKLNNTEMQEQWHSNDW